MLRTFARLFALLTLLSGVPAASLASPPRFPDIMPISQVRPGMKGYGLTVFRGTQIVRFNVTVVGVVKRGSLIVPGHDMILVKMSGGPMTSRQANLIRGMSGSPVYINGKIIGAFSMGEPATKEPLGGVTPIEDMLEAWDPKLPQSPVTSAPDNRPRTVRLPEPITVGSRRIETVVFNAPLKSGLRSHGTKLVLHPCTTFVTVSGLSAAARQKLQAALEPYNVEVAHGAPGGQQRPNFKGAPLVPGAAFSMMLVAGDVSVGATGTVSYRRGNRILGFGHPFLGIGPIEAPLCSAYVYDVYPLLSGSYKISSPGPIAGASVQDRNFSVSGVLGKKPRTIPVTVNVRDITTGRRKLFRMQICAHPNLYAQMVSVSATSAVSEIRNTPGATLARVRTTVDAEELGRITRDNVVFDLRGIDTAVTGDLDELLSILTGNPFYPLGIRSAQIEVEIESGRRTAQIERIFVKEGRFEPGETAEIGIVIKPYRQPAVTRFVKITIPENAATGRYMLQVRGGALPPPVSFGGMVIRQAPPQQGEVAPPANVRQMVNRFLEREKSNEIAVRLLLPSLTVNIEGERMTNLPPSLDTILRSSRSSGVRLEREDVKIIEKTDWVISGTQMLTLNVQRKDVLEAPSGGPGGGGTSGGISAPPSGSGSSFDNDFAAGLHNDPVSAERAFIALSQGQKPAESSPAQPTQKPADPNSGQTSKPAEPTPAQSAPAEPAQGTETPVVRSPQVWKQTSRTDFEKGTARGVSVNSRGDLSLTRLLERWQTSSESFLWSLIPDGSGGLIAGTGNRAHILHFDAQGKRSVLARLPEIAVFSLLRTPEGTLYAATAPNGRTYRVERDGSFSIAHQAPERYALALARDSKGNLYVGTAGGKGCVYRITPDGKSSLFFRTADQHVLSLAMDREDHLIVGTGNSGIVYRVAPDGRGKVLYDAVEQSITALGVNSRGELYAATAPRGVVYRINADGSARSVYERSAGAVTSLSIGQDDTVYLTTGSMVIALTGEDNVLVLDNRRDVDFLSLTVSSEGAVYTGTANVAEVYRAARAEARQQGVYESVVHDARQPASWGAVRWTASVPPGTSLNIQTRTGNVAEPDSSWSDWTSLVRGSEGSAQVNSPSARFIQYRILLSSDTPSVSPLVRDIAITYLPRNQAPKVSLQAPAAGDRWARQQTIRWEASDPDRDTLSFELFYSSDDGKTWRPLPASAHSAKPETHAATGAAAPEKTAPASAPTVVRPRPPSVSDVAAELDRHPDLPPPLREAILERAKEAVDEYEASLKSVTPQASAPPAQNSTRETSRALDTKILPDGCYRLKVIASDRASNATGALTAEAVSEPFVICNALPTLYLLSSSLRVNADRTVYLEGSATQRLIPITAVQYRISGGEWLAAAPADGIFDSMTENFIIVTGSLPPGTHTLEVKAFNATNATVTARLTVEVK
jgi:sugar lactone lactonase YvrE